MEVTYVARQTDGLILCESWDSGTVSNQMKRQAKEVLKRLGHAGTAPRCTLDCPNGMFFNYIIDDGVIFMTLSQRSFSKKAVFLFLEEVAAAFREELKLSFGTHSTDYRSVIETIEKSYYFIHFDRTIRKKKQTFQDPYSGRALQKLNDSLSEVTSIMRQNVDDILQRGENLESVGRKADDLKLSSSQFARAARVLSLRALVEKYVPLAVVLLVVLVIVVCKFWF